MRLNSSIREGKFHERRVKMFKRNMIKNDVEEELHWLRGYVNNLEDGLKAMQSIINESVGVAGYHLNGNLATWDELLVDSEFELAEDNMKEKARFYTSQETTRVTAKMRKELYIKIYKDMPCSIQYTPVYGGVKYVRADR